MFLPVRWLKDYVKTDRTTRDLADGLTASGSHVESIINMNKGIKNVVVGRILKIQEHPNADKLIICTVDIGSEKLTIVTGAKNLSEGVLVPVAKVGAKLADGNFIDKTDFRGVASDGMLCSLQELGYADSVIPKEVRDGIYIFNEEYPLGDNVVDILGINDEVIEFEITPNRPDCLSIIGMARETAATFDEEFKLPEIVINKQEDDIYDYTNGIEVKTDKCIRYYSKVVKNVDIKPSPLWMQTRLMEAGVRPISNIVDITNFVMLEYGEPLHAFDLSQLADKRIIVRQAENNEILTTLDGVERKLDENDIVIADAQRAIGLAGVMGGLNSEITKDTKTVLFEGANFNSKSIRFTSKKLGLRSEASTRFEKGIDPTIGKDAVDRVCQLVELIGAGEVVDGSIDIYNEKATTKNIILRPERTKMLLGVDLSTEEMMEYLNRLGLYSTYDGKVIDTVIPTYRLDLGIEDDLIEEIGRLYGYHNIESKPLIGALTRGRKPYSNQILDKVKGILKGYGLNETMTYSFISPKAYDKVNLDSEDKKRQYIKLINPLGEDFSSMRTTILPNMLDLLSKNYNRGIESMYAYEIGNTFIPKILPIKELPNEKKVLTFGFYGDTDFYDLKSIIIQCLKEIGINNVGFEREENNPTFHPGRTAKIFYNNSEIGIIGEIHPDVLDNYDIKTKVYAAELDFELIVEHTNLSVTYKPLPKYPAIVRDIALVVDEEVLVGEIEKVILENGKDLIESIKLFDIYRGNQIKEGLKSVAYSIVYRSFDRTLKEDEINLIQQDTIKELEMKFKASLRNY